ncbi:MAG: hypothetical protein HYX52_04045 [Chloroflexi bacterium]|nr:hypothetical protein [Chloroflexota bacterium]
MNAPHDVRAWRGPDDARLANSPSTPGWRQGVEYRRLAAHVASQIAERIDPTAATFVPLPVVGFGGQSKQVLGRTLALLSRLRPALPIQVAILVNRPSHQPPDDTEAFARNWVERQPSGPVRFALGSVALPVRPRLGDLRQMLCDAIVDVAGPWSTDAVVVLADDDLVGAPSGWIDRLSQAVTVQPDVDIALGPVLFDDASGSAVQCAPFFLADALRALLAGAWVERLSQWQPDDQRVSAPLRTVVLGYAEAIALSGNLAVRARALEAVGGFRPLNEITNVVRDVHGRGSQNGEVPSAPHGGIGSTWGFDAADPEALLSLYRSAVRVSARRAAQAYATARQPSVAQWRTCRFQASRVDPVRVEPLPALPAYRVRQLARSGMAALVNAVEPLLAATLAYFPPDQQLAREALRVLGLDEAACTTTLVAENAWTVRIHDPAEMLTRLEALQEEPRLSPMNGGAVQARTLRPL